MKRFVRRSSKRDLPVEGLSEAREVGYEEKEAECRSVGDRTWEEQSRDESEASLQLHLYYPHALIVLLRLDETTSQQAIEQTKRRKRRLTCIDNLFFDRIQT